MSPQSDTPEPEDTIYLGVAWEAAQTLTLSQGYSAIPITREQQIANQEWTKLCVYYRSSLGNNCSNPPID